MANIIDRYGNYIKRIDDGVLKFQFEVTDAKYTELDSSFVVYSKEAQERTVLIVSGLVTKDTIAFLDIGSFEDKNGTPWGEETFREFLDYNTGTNGVLYYDNPTGWASYVDTQYHAENLFTVPAATNTILPNNAGTTIDSQIPLDVESFYTGGVITGRDGDSIDLQIYFYAIPSVNDQVIDVWLDIGGAVGVIYTQSFGFPKGAGEERGILYAIPSGYTGSTWEANGATVYVRSTNTFDLYGVTMNVDRSHKAKPVI